MSEQASQTPDVKESTVVEKPTDSPSKILEGVKQLANTTLYVLTHSYYRGEDAHLVLQAKEFIKEIRHDIERKQKDLAEGKEVKLG